VAFDPDVIDLVEATARRLGHTTKRLPPAPATTPRCWPRVARPGWCSRRA
jgi:hypothetical protein